MPNSLAWSLDGHAMYLPAATIWRFAFSPDAGPTARERFARTPAGTKPDGGCVDAEDCLWVAHWGGARVVRYRPDGTIDIALDVSVRHPTCVAFGGPELNHLFVTSERPGADDRDGAMLVYRTQFRGVPESRCALQTMAVPA